jgi:hypothetical protein
VLEVPIVGTNRAAAVGKKSAEHISQFQRFKGPRGIEIEVANRPRAWITTTVEPRGSLLRRKAHLFEPDLGIVRQSL